MNLKTKKPAAPQPPGKAPLHWRTEVLEFVTAAMTVAAIHLPEVRRTVAAVATLARQTWSLYQLRKNFRTLSTESPPEAPPADDGAVAMGELDALQASAPAHPATNGTDDAAAYYTYFHAHGGSLSLAEWIAAGRPALPTENEPPVAFVPDGNGGHWQRFPAAPRPVASAFRFARGANYPPEKL